MENQRELCLDTLVGQCPVNYLEDKKNPYMLENTAFSMLALDYICLQSQFVTLNLVLIIYIYKRKYFIPVSLFLIFGPKRYI